MFRKPYKVKTSTTVKGSDRRKLKSLVENHFPSIPAEDLNALIPNKGEMNQVKALTHSGTIAMIYYSGLNPVFFQIWDTCYPTLYTLWKYPSLLPTITMVPPVTEKIANGADLMAPGVVVSDSTIKEMNNLKTKDVCAVKVIGNKAAFAVGTAMMSVEELCIDGVKGKAMSIVHFYGDLLHLSGEHQEMPLLLEPAEVPSDTEDDSSKSQNDASPDKKTDDSSSMEILSNCSENKVTNEMNELNLNKESRAEEDIPDYSMDEILLNCFLAVVKVSGKKINLPVLTSTFYGAHVLKSCPSSLTLDIKKTTYKKFSVFLKKMQTEGVIEIKELTKGVESIISINMDREIVTSFRLHPIFKKHLKEEKERLAEASSEGVQTSYKFPLVTELYVITAQVKELFTPYQIRKGDTVTAITIRDVMKKFVKENSLQNEHNPKEVVLNPILCDCVSKRGENRTTMLWDELFDAITSRMTHAYQIEFEDKEAIIKKGKLEPIKVTVDTRTGNKKVTLIQNLEIYGIKPELLAQHVAVACAASTSITPTQNAKGTLVLIQGNQVRYLQKLFLDIYKVPRKYLQGLENVPKKK
ncbi:eukaryotic translation initiation factor 2D [Parasteatoda tepidariorum]|uniref:eukaryotic translation initiation factor 2D n=1 Tax=Parasteatoda tepidariorum TaxID=114398 RepID=UPI001C726C4D|nr:eukaryotic translation initiation factor 2D isoform X1 [Parasteatoda tepidariorum]XP_042911165.1 eukaryotic translation initiation factor 2D isoform X2 [Parasteatoda tepidariorum]